MLAVISPAKTLDYESVCPPHQTSEPAYLDESAKLITTLRRKSKAELQELMGISENLAELNQQRYREWSLPFTGDNARAALFAFKGDVYTGFTLDTYTPSDLQFTQKHLRILSGLYGLLRPLDLMQPYRLEMGTSLKTRKGTNLYQFWGEQITDGVNEALAGSESDVLVNLASQEYFGAVSAKGIKGRIISPQFRDFKGGDYKIISFFAKKARGMMCDFIVKNRLSDPEALKAFDREGYRYNPELSEELRPVFTRNPAA
jgi:uncharacterized protein